MCRSSSVWEDTFLKQIEDEESSSPGLLRKKLPRIWRVENTLLSGRKYWKTTKIGIIFYAGWWGITYSESILPRSWLTEQLWRPTFIKLLLPRVCREPRREVGMPRNTREDMRYSWKRFWLSTCSTRSWWITQWFKEFGDIIGHSENRRNWGKWERRTIAVNTFILFLGKSKTKSLDGGKRPLFMTRHGNSELSPLGNASVIPWPNKISEPNCEFPSRSLRTGS